MSAAERDQPLRRGLHRESPPDPCALVIFGATGDLAHRKLVPALYNLQVDGLLPASCAMVGVARRAVETEEFVRSLAEGVAQHSRRGFDESVWKELAPRISYVPSRFDDPEGYRRLAQHLEELDRRLGTAGNRLFYLATPPSAFPVIVGRLGEAGLNRPGAGGAWSRVVVEKPVGRDLRSARDLNRRINGVFDEGQVYRIDHYLGKETVQNLLVFRFANAIFEPIWNARYVDHVQITVAESIGVEGRGAYYEEAGTTRDMVQNHMFQLLCLTAMEPPIAVEADAIRDEKVKVLRALRRLSPEDVPAATARGRYGPGVVDGERVPGYTDEEGVAPDSRTETYVALRLFVDNWRWGGTPFYLRAGKRLPRRVTEIALRFRDVPHRLFRSGPGRRLDANVLALTIQPDEGIAIRFDSKVPGAESRIRPVAMDFRYGTSFGVQAAEAYERLLLDAILGDSTLFIRRDEVEAAWGYVDRLFEGWAAAGDAPPPVYASGTWGPEGADRLLARDGRAWRRL